MRIVSLLASATEIVCALGAGGMLVGRSHECDNPEWVRALPPCSEPAFDVAGSSASIDAEVRRRLAAGEELYRIDAEKIAELRPELIIAQTHCDVCAVTPEGIRRAGATVPVLRLSAFTLQEIFASIGEVAKRLGLTDRGVKIIEAERARINAVREKTRSLRRPSVVMLEWTDPLFAMGNWGPELVETAGGDLQIGEKGAYSATLEPELLIASDPEFLIIAPCGFTLARAMEERAALEKNPWWHELRAAREGKVAFADGNRFFNRSGMTIARTCEIVAEILHGVTFPEPAKDVYYRWIGDMA
ncbi:MAG TPA: ABC transporter substrate-binding protein [Bryobacteraceae bacterium]|nr:ABC transporter substrate-binding protein [Bryobacteraceae bacterium]